MKKKQILSLMLSLTMAVTAVSIPATGFAAEEGAFAEPDQSIAAEESLTPESDDIAAEDNASADAVTENEADEESNAAATEGEAVNEESEQASNDNAAAREVQSESRSFNAVGASAKGKTARQYFLNTDGEVYYSNGETVSFTKSQGGSIQIASDESEYAWDQADLSKTVWRIADPSVAKIGYWKGDNACVSAGSAVTLKDGHGIWLVPQKAGTAQISVDLYDNTSGSLVTTLKLNITISQKEFDRAKYESYTGAAYLTEADFTKQTLYGKLKPVSAYNKTHSAFDPEITADDLQKLSITVTAGGKTSNATINKSNYTFSGKFPKVKLGTKVVVTYTMGSCTVKDSIQVTKWINPTVKPKNYTYNGKWRDASATVKYGKIKLTDNDYYCTGEGKDVGRYKYRVWCGDEEDGVWGNYRFKDKVGYFIINPKGTSIKSLKKGKKAITVKWNKQAMKMSKSRITGYQVQLATNKKFTKNKKVVTVKGYKNTSKKIKSLKKKTKYFVRVRTYKKVGKYTFYSNWSKAKSMKTK